jgi:hypothetical protein
MVDILDESNTPTCLYNSANACLTMANIYTVVQTRVCRYIGMSPTSQLFIATFKLWCKKVLYYWEKFYKVKMLQKLSSSLPASAK